MTKFFPPRTLELTFALIKPHAVRIPPIVENIKQRVIDEGFFIVESRRCILDKESAAEMYEEHIGKPFYDRLVNMMTSGAIVSFILAKENAIKDWRDLMGPTRAVEAQYTQPRSLRGLYGLSNTRNATHGSDSPKSFEREAKIFFPDFDPEDWYKNEERYFSNGYVVFDEDSSTHQIDDDNAPECLE